MREIVFSFVDCFCSSFAISRSLQSLKENEIEKMLSTSTAAITAINKRITDNMRLDLASGVRFFQMEFDKKVVKPDIAQNFAFDHCFCENEPVFDLLTLIFSFFSPSWMPPHHAVMNNIIGRPLPRNS